MPAATDPEPAARMTGNARAAAPRVARGKPLGAQMLASGTRLRDYEITDLIGGGDFGIVYLAFDHSLQRQIAIKEFMPTAMAMRSAGSGFVNVRSDQDATTFRAGLKSFLNEARLLARFDQPSLVKVYRFWEENGTAYMAMPFYDGPTLKSALANLGHVPTESELRAWLRPVLNAVTVMHEGGVYHHHIGTDNIRLTETGPVLLDFAAARRVVEGETRTLATSLKPGYAAIEQYGDGAAGTQGAWTDLYALAAVLYTAITGAAPMAAPERLAHDGVLKLRAAAATLYSDPFLQAIDAALSLQPEARPRDHAQFRALMRDIEAPNDAVALSALRDLMLEPFVVDLTRTPGEITVPDMAATEHPAPRRSRPGALADAHPTGPGSLSGAGRTGSTPGAPGGAGPRSRPGPLEHAARHSRPGALGAVSTTRPGTLEPTPSGAQPLGSTARHAEAGPAKKTLSPKAARIAAAHEHSGEPSDLHPDVDFSGALEGARFLDRFGSAAKAGIAVAALAAIGLAVWLAKPDDTDNGAAAAAATTTRAAPAAPRTVPAATLPLAAPSTVAAAPPGNAPATLAADPNPSNAADGSPPITAAARQARCVEILQKVSLEPMTPADAAFYKKECHR